MDHSTIRLADLEPHETVRVRCRCGRIADLMHLYIRQTLRLPLETPVADLARRLRCKVCGATGGLRISIFDENCRYDASIRDRERVIVDGSGK
jgi:hypothetical protein